MARSFSGSGQDLNLGSAALLQITGNITVACWGKTGSSAVGYLLSANDIPGTNGWGVGHSILTAGKLGYYSSGTGVWAENSTAWNNNAWRHLAIRISGPGTGAGTFYLDGSADGTFSQTAPSAYTGTKRIAAGTDGSLAFTGSLAEMAVWNVALDAGEIAALAKGFSPLFIRPQSLVAYWPLRGYAAPEPDLWSNNLAGTLTGSPSAVDHPRVLYPALLHVMTQPVLNPTSTQRTVNLFGRRDVAPALPARRDINFRLSGSV